MADRPTIAELFGPPPEDQQTNLAEPRVCPLGGPCTCDVSGGGRWLRARRPVEVRERDEQWMARIQERRRKLLATKDPALVQLIRESMERTAEQIGCPRRLRLH